MNDYLNTNRKSLIRKIHDEGIEKSNVDILHSEGPANPVCYIKLYLKPKQLVILKNC